MDPSHPSFNSSHLLSMVGQNQDLARQVIITFVDQAVALLEEADTVMNNQDTERLRQISHKLAGSARTLGAEAFGQECRAVEVKLIQWDAPWDSEIERDFQSLKQTFTALKAELNAFGKK